VQKLFQFFKSVKLAVVLLIFITVTAVLATLVPQGRELAFYYHTYSSFLTWIIVNTQFHSFFRSFIFIFAAILFFINLSVCTIDRLTREFKGKRKKRFGPDMIHIGLLILIVGSLVTFLGRLEGFMYMAPGDEIKLPGGYVVELESFEYYTYDDGSPKDWISTVDVYKNDEQIVDSFPIEVNKPLNVGRIDVFQSSYAEESRVVLEGIDGREIKLSEGRPLETNEAAYVLSGIGADPDNGKQQAAFLEKWQNQERTGLFKVVVGDVFAGYTVRSLGVLNVTGLQAVIDPGFTPVLIGLILAGLGLAVTYLQKIGDKEI
jgi:cytochrome c biogenesis protein ResB